jgi:S-formylglutathione hydrolase FrmB
MSTLHVSFYSPALARATEFYLVKPDKPLPPFLLGNPHYQRPTKTLFLLHGYSGDCHDWLYNGGASALSMQYNLAVVMPTGGVSFYLDREATGHKYCSLLGMDIINYLRETFGLAMTREDTWIGGASMGGFGALHTALAFPDRFSGVVALSSALIVHQLPKMEPGFANPMANYDYYVETFGDLKTAEERDCNPELLYRNAVAEGKPLPRIYMACGTEDFLMAENRNMRDFLEAQKADYIYKEGPGVHDWSFWVPRSQEGVRWLLKEEI